MSDSQERVTCPGCGKGYRWQTKLIDRKVPCKACGMEFIVPTAPGTGIAIEPDPRADDGTYDLDLDESGDGPAQHATPAKGGKCPSCNSPVREGALLCMNCGFNMAEGKKVQTDVAAAPVEPDESYDGMTKKQRREAALLADMQAEHWHKHYKGPAILAVIGLAMVLLNNLVLGPMAPMFDGYSFAEIALGLTIHMGYTLVINSALMFAALLILVYVFGQGFGSLSSVLIKIAAVVFCAEATDFFVVLAMDNLIGTGGMGYYVSWAIYLAVMIVLCMKMFDLDITEFRVLIWFVIIGQVATDFIFEWMLGMML